MENALLVRAYEAMGMQTEAVFSVADRVRQVEETDMLEENGRAFPPGKRLAVHFGSFEIKTFLLHL